jgi:MFS family permease
VPGPETGVRGRTVALVVASALFMENIDSTILATALPTIAADLNVNPLSLKLALTSYLVSLAIFIPPSGWVADRYGARRVFAAAVLVFLAGSLACTLATSLSGFVVARFLQGMGGAMMVPVGRLIVARSTPKAGIRLAMAWLTTPALLGPVLGPLVGGDHRHALPLAVDLPDQPAGRASCAWAWRWRFLPREAPRRVGAVSTAEGVPAVGPGPGRADAGVDGGDRDDRALSAGRCLACWPSVRGDGGG